MPEIVLLVGLKDSGKSTASKYFTEHLGYYPLSFADSLKDVVAAIFCWPREMLEGITPESRVWRETVDPWWSQKLNIANFTPRMAMLLVGSDAMRNHFHQDIWSLSVERKIANLGNRKIIIIDGRFSNEIKLVRKKGARVFRIKRDADPFWFPIARLANSGDMTAKEKLKQLGVHDSEYNWVGSNFDYIIENDSDIVSLFKNIETALSL